MPNIDSRSKRLAALEILASTGMWKSSYAPPLHRLLWRLGLELTPPHFAGFCRNLAYCGGIVGTGLGSYLAFCRLPVAESALSGAGAGLFFGLFMATYYAISRRYHSLPSWEDLPGAARSSPQVRA